MPIKLDDPNALEQWNSPTVKDHDSNRIPQEAPYILTPEELEAFRSSLDIFPLFPPIREPVSSIKLGIPKFGIPFPNNPLLQYICGYVDISIEFIGGRRRHARVSLTEENALRPYYTAMSWNGILMDIANALCGTTNLCEIPRTEQEMLVLVDENGQSKKFADIKILQLYLVTKGIFLRGRELDEVEHKRAVILNGLVIYWTSE